jgi:hypothetical protein
MIHDSMTPGGIGATHQEDRTQPAVRKNHIRIKIPKVTIKCEPNTAAAPISDTTLPKKVKLRISHSHGGEKDTSEGQVSIVRKVSLADVLPSAAYSDCSLEAKAQQILAMARLRLKASMAGNDTVPPLAVPKWGETELVVDSLMDKTSTDAVAESAKKFELGSRQSRVRSESPVSLPSEDHIMHCNMSNSASSNHYIVKPETERIQFSNNPKKKSSQRDDGVMPTAAPQILEKGQECKSLPKYVGDGCLHVGKSTLQSITHGSTMKKEAKNLSSKNLSRKTPRKSSLEASKKTLKSSAKESHRSHARKKVQSYQLLDLSELDSDSDKSDWESSTTDSSGSSSSISSSTSSSSSVSSSSSSSSSVSSSVSSSSSSSNSSSSSSSSSDSDVSSDDESHAPLQLPPTLKQRSRSKKAVKKNRRYSRKSSDISFVAQPPPPKVTAPTEAEIRKILLEDSATFGESNCNWVRRSSRQPSKSVLNSAGVRDLLDKLKCNDSDMVVLKMKKYLNDPDIPPVIMNAALDALEENSNCQALYIQVKSFWH